MVSEHRVQSVPGSSMMEDTNGKVRLNAMSVPDCTVLSDGHFGKALKMHITHVCGVVESVQKEHVSNWIT